MSSETTQPTTVKSAQLNLKRGWLFDHSGDPRWNMAFDTWLATEAPLAEGEFALRVYHWAPAGLTIGANQRWERALDERHLAPDQIAVRRITGGRAIFHDEREVTYAVALECAALTPLVVSSISARIAEAICAALVEIGAPARIESSRRAQPPNRGARSEHCFGSLTRHEIIADGLKIAAGAQRILRTRFFQHGSIKPHGFVAHPALFATSGKSTTEPPREARNSLPLKQSFERVFDCALNECRPTTSERRSITALRETLDIRRGAPVRQPEQLGLAR
ncbi:MAG TPA: hypothetical protein VLB27_12030 [candidate division Zixibacteria bacterium]|nr:hypothetical protein [candidate division Zixibacteria bacterium]